MTKRKTRFRISRSSLAQIDKAGKTSLRKMTLRLFSMMKNVLDYEAIHNDVVVAIAKDKDTALGWALKRPWSKDRNLVMVYVKPEFRRKGVGRALVKSFKDRELYFRSWDDQSEKFFRAVMPK